MTRTERTYYLLFALYCVAWSSIAPIYPLFLLSRGLDVFQMTLVPATYFLVAFLFEVPTGAVADLAGRKVSFILSCVIRMLAFALYVSAHGFVDCLIAEFVDGVGTTLASGALEAWAVDGMRAEGERRPADRFFARAQMLSRTLMIVAGVVAGYVADIRIEVPWIVGAASFGTTAVLGALLMREPRPVRVRGSLLRTIRSDLRKQLRESVATVRRAPVLRLLCGITLVTGLGVMPVHILWQPHLTALTGEGVWLMGWIWALLHLAGIAGSGVVSRLPVRFGRAAVLGAVALGRGAMIILAGAARTPYTAVAGLLGQEAGFGISEPLVQAWMNEHIEAAQRATVLSVRAMSFTLGGAIGLAVVGFIARTAGMPIAWLAAGLFMASAAVGYAMLGRLATRAEVQTEPIASPDPKMTRGEIVQG